MAFEELHQPLFREHGSLYFVNGKQPSEEFNYAFCEVCLVHRRVLKIFDSLTHPLAMHTCSQ